MCRGGSDPTPPGLTRRLTPRWSLPPRSPSIQNVSLADISLISISSALDTRQIKSGSFADTIRIRQRYNTDS
jgi:hypothetical protein